MVPICVLSHPLIGIDPDKEKCMNCTFKSGKLLATNGCIQLHFNLELQKYFSWQSELMISSRFTISLSGMAVFTTNN